MPEDRVIKLSDRRSILMNQSVFFPKSCRPCRFYPCPEKTSCNEYLAVTSRTIMGIILTGLLGTAAVLTIYLVKEFLEYLAA